jgi:hypothetical protein
VIIPQREEAGAEIAMLAGCDADNDDEVNEDAAAAAAITAAADAAADAAAAAAAAADDDDDDDDEPMWTAEQAEDIVYESEANEQEGVMSTHKQPTGPVMSRPAPSASSSSSVAASEAGSHVLRHPAANRDPPDDATHAASHITYPRELVWRYYDDLAQQSGHTQPHSARGYSRHHNRMQHRLPAWTPW